MPALEPVPLLLMVTPGLSSMKASPSTPMTFSMEVEPSVFTTPERVVLCSAEGAALPSPSGAEGVAVPEEHPARRPMERAPVRAREKSLFMFFDLLFKRSKVLFPFFRTLSV